MVEHFGLVVYPVPIKKRNNGVIYPVGNGKSVQIMLIDKHKRLHKNIQASEITSGLKDNIKTFNFMIDSSLTVIDREHTCLIDITNHQLR